MEKEKKIFVYAVFKDSVSLKYEVSVFAGQAESKDNIYNVWYTLPALGKVWFNFPSVRQAKKLIRQMLCIEQAPEYACIVVNGKMKGIWWTHIKKHIETITVSQFKRELWTNGGVVADEIFKGICDICV